MTGDVEQLANGISLISGDCVAALPELDADSFDACVTDPPYHLTSQVATVRNAFPGRYAGTKGADKGFMGKTWDGGDVAFQVETWEQVYRVLKPGAHLLACGGTRTYHRMACAIEDAGFEIRDCVQWLYGSGFPKSLDVSKGIARRRIEDVEPVRVVCRFIRAAMDAQGIKSRDLATHFDCDPRLIDHWAARDTDSQPLLPTLEQYDALARLLDLGASMDGEVARLNGRKGTAGAAWSEADVIAQHDGEPGGFGDHRFNVRDRSIRDLTGVAADWSGWGTALKPACELIVLARKPLSESTVAANVLKWGTGALNIDACRVGTDLIEGSRGAGGQHGKFSPIGAGSYSHEGRWPANVIHDGSDEVVAAFPAARSGEYPANRAGVGYHGGAGGTIGERQVIDEGGSAARFFYTAKADDDDRLGSKHPTVKPLDLIQYLVRLITPPCGLILDPFAGTGTTGEAAFREGFRAVLIEREKEYQNDIRRRMKLLLAGSDERAHATIKEKTKDKPIDAGPLFDWLAANSEAAE